MKTSIIALLMCLTMPILTSEPCLSFDNQGKCTKCDALSFLDSGKCYQKIRGCLKNIAGPLCILCQSGYVLQQNDCIREAIFYDRTDLNPSPIVFKPAPALTYAEIRDRLGQKYGVEFSKAHKSFLNLHSQLANPKVIDVSLLKTKMEALMMIKYQTSNNETYIGVMIINRLDQLKQVYFGKKSQDPVSAYNQLIQKTEINQLIKGLTLLQFMKSEDFYVYDFINATSRHQVIRIAVNKNDVATERLNDGLEIKKLTVFDLAEQKCRQIHPSLLDKKRIAQNKVTQDIILLQFQPNLLVSIEFKDFIFKVNNPSIKQQISDQDESDKQTIGDGFVKLSDWSQDRIGSAENFIYSQFPQISKADLVEIYQQNVEGTNYRFKFIGPTSNDEETEQFIVIVYQNVKGQNTLISVSKNGERRYFPFYDYNSDINFLSSYTLIQQQSKITNIPSVSRVSVKLLTDNLIEYLVVYSETENAVLIYDKLNKKATLISYNVGGENVLQVINGEMMKKSTIRSQEVLFNFLIGIRPELSNSRIQHISFNSQYSYDLSIVSHVGTYLATIDDRDGQLHLAAYEKVSDQTCFQMAHEYIEKNQKIQYINDFLQKNYPLEGYKIQLIQANVDKSTVLYRFLYSSQKLRQIEIKIIEEFSQAKVQKASVLNFGYEVLNPEPNDENYQKAIKVLSESDLDGDKVPFYSEVNSTSIRTFYNSGNSTIEIVIDKKTEEGKGYVIAERKVKICPDAIQFQNLLNLNKVTLEQSKKINTIINAAKGKFTKYLQNATLRFVGKVKYDNYERYTFYMKSTFGYTKFHANWRKSQQSTIQSPILIEQLVITEDKDEDFSNCKQWDTNEKCLSCADNEVEYQGACHKKLQGCLIQPGDICVRCNTNYIRSGFKCFRDCYNFFD